MKVWHLTRTASGGAGQYAVRLNDGLSGVGYESAVWVAEQTGGDKADLLRRKDASLRRLVARGIRSVSHRISFGPFHSLRGVECYEGPKVSPGDIVHLHGMTGWIGVSGLRRLIPRGARVFWTAHDLWIVSGGCVVYRGCDQFRRNCSGCPILRSPWKRLAKQELKAKRSFVEAFGITPIANSRWTADRIRESALFHHLDAVPVIPPIVDDAYLAEEIPDLRQELGISAERLVVSLGARSINDEFKGIPQFLNELSQAKDLAGRVTVLVFGPGQIVIPGNLDVRLLGALTDPRRLARVYRSSNIYVSPSHMETFGMTLVEAQATGTPVMAFSVGGTPEAVCDGETGWLLPVGDFKMLMEQLRLQLKDESKLRDIGARAHGWVKLNFSGPAVASRQAAIYAGAGVTTAHA
jgi:glycosyltransferase involved in cell wall biosynthesis